jgi:hypothetical protein
MCGMKKGQEDSQGKDNPWDQGQGGDAQPEYRLERDKTKDLTCPARRWVTPIGLRHQQRLPETSDAIMGDV